MNKMNLPEDNNFPLFKYSPEITSQFLIQTNQNVTQEFVEIPNISDDLLLTGLEDGTYTWTLNSLPILLNNQPDQDEPLQELQPQFNEFLTEESASENNTEIVLPLELSEKNFLTENGLFITNNSEDITPCELELVSGTFSAENLVNQNEIQSSDVSSQEAYIDINGLLIPQSSTREFLLNVEDAPVPKKVKNKKRKIRQKSEKQKREAIDELLNIEEVHNEKIDELKEIGLEIDNEPDSTTIFNDLDDNLNIDELATIVQTYQCKKCDFSCNKREEFMLHFRELHYVVNVQKKKTNLKVKNKKNLTLKSTTKSLIEQQVNNTVQLIINENGDLISNYNVVDELKTPNIILKEEPIEATNILDDSTLNPVENKDLFEPKTSNNCFEQVKIIYNDKEYAGLIYVQNEEKEKKIMRIKRKKKPQQNVFTSKPTKKTKSNIPEKETSEIKPKPNEKLKKDSQISPIFLCATCSDQFSSVEECKIHYIEVHKYEDKSKETKTPEKEKVEDKVEANLDKKEILEKFFKQDVLKKRKHKCPVKGCPYRFAKIDLLKRHETCHINGTRSPFCCPECKEQFSSWRMCSIHLWKCHKVDIDFYTCPLCDYKGSTYDKLKHHVKIHSEDREYSCPDCGRDFKQPSQLRNHRVIHLDKKNMQNVPRWFIQKHCEMCGKLFADSKCLKKHIQAVHSKLKPFICNVCGHSCARKAMLQLHLRQHTGDKPYSCSICLYKTGDHNSLRRHTMRHTGDRPYKCPYCDYAAIQSNSYKNHLAAKHPGKSGFFKCNECAFKTVNEDIFYSHKNDHALGLIRTDKGKTPDKLIKNISTTDTSNNNMKNTRQPNFKEKKNIEIEDDETQNCLFSSLGDLTDEQTVDTGGITIPADPDDPSTIIA